MYDNMNVIKQGESFWIFEHRKFENLVDLPIFIVEEFLVINY